MESLSVPQLLSYLLIGMLIFNLTQRNHMDHGSKKRFASLYLSVGVLLLLGLSALFNTFGIPLVWLIPVALAEISAVIYFRNILFPFRRSCPVCNKPYTLKEIFYYDYPHEHENTSGSPQPHKQTDALSPVHNEAPRNVDDVDWANWQFSEYAVLCFIRQEDKIMLIHKKTGLGAGKINGPGGRIEKDETPEAAAVRECQEEIGLTPENPEKVAELNFIFTDGYSLHGTVFISESYKGTPVETEEADPFWCDLDSIPYHNMWEDDPYWLPRVLNGEKLLGRFIFEGDTMLSREIKEL